MADAKFRQAARRLRDTLARKYETAQTTQTAGPIGDGKLVIGGQIYDGAVEGLTTVVNTGRLAAAQYAPKVGGSVVVSSSGGGSTGTGVSTGPDVTLLSLITLNPESTLTNERYLAVETSLTKVDGGASGPLTLGLATPGTVTSSSTNNATGAHTHAVSASANPGAAESLLKTDSSGLLTLVQLTATTKVRAPLIDTASGALTLSPANSALTINANVTVQRSTSATATVGVYSAGDTSGLYPRLALHRARTTPGSETATASGDILGVLSFRGHDGSAYHATGVAEIRGVASETFTGSANGANLRFLTTAIGSTTLTERMRIHNSGNVSIANSTDNGFTLDVTGTGRLTTSLTTPLITTANNVDLVINPAGTGAVQFPNDQTLRTTSFDSSFPINGWQINEVPGISGYSSLTIGKIQADELAVRVFVADEVRVDRGDEFWTKSYGIIAQTFTTPAALNGTVSVKFEDSPALAGAIFTNNDWVLIRKLEIDTGITLFNVWGQVSSYVNNSDGTQNWTFTLRSGPTSTEITKGSLGIDFGASGSALIHLSVIDSAGAPYIKMRKWAGANPYTPSNFTTYVQVGHLGSIGNSYYTPSGYGLYIRSIANEAQFIVADDNGLQLRGAEFKSYNGANQTVSISSANGSVKLGTNIANGTTTGFSFDGATGNLTIGNASYASTVTVYGQIVIKAGSTGYGNMTDRPTTLEQLDATADAKLDGIEANATVGATWGTNLNSIPARFGNAPSSAGLYLTATHLGYYNGSAWKAWIASTGEFYFGGSTGAHLEWNGSQLQGIGTDGTTAQWYAQSASGKLFAGAGAVVLSANGIDLQRYSVTPGTNPNPTDNINSISWWPTPASIGGSDTPPARIWGYTNTDGAHGFQIDVNPGDSHGPRFWIEGNQGGSPTYGTSLWLSDIDNVLGIPGFSALRGAGGTTVTLSGSIQLNGNTLPNADNTRDLGSASYRFKTIYVDQVVASSVSGASMSGQEWEYAGSMTIDANSASNTTVSIVNQGAGSASLSVESDITVGGTVDGVDLSVFKADYDTHVGGGDVHAIYLLATGTRAGATSQAQDFNNGVVVIAPNATTNQLTLRSARAAIASGNTIGGIAFQSNDTSLTAPGTVVASIVALTTAAHTAAQLGTELVFSATSGTTFSEAMRITQLGPKASRWGMGTASPTANRIINLADTLTADALQYILYTDVTVDNAITATRTSFGQQFLVRNARDVTDVGVYDNNFYGSNVNVYNNAGSVANNVYGNNAQVINEGNGTIAQAFGGLNQVQNQSSGTITTLFGQSAEVENQSTGTVTTMYGNRAYVYNTNGPVTTAYGYYSWMRQNGASGSVGTTYAFYARQDRDAGTSTNAYLYYGVFEGTHTVKRGLWITGDTENSLGGKLTIGTDAEVGGVIYAAAGSASLPAITATTDPNTGLYWSAADTLAIATGGTLRMAVSTSALTLSVPTLTNASGTLTLAATTDILLDPASNYVKATSGVTLASDNYTSQTTGWSITYGGAGDFRYLYTDEMHAKAFIADLEQALAGGQIIAKSVTLLYSAFTAPAAGATAALTVKDLPSATGMAVFQNGDFIRVRTFSRSSGSLTIGDCWGTVVLDTTYGTSGFDSATKSQRYTFTRSSGGNAGAMTAGTVVAADAIVLDYGTSGNGYYEVNAIDGAYAANSPYAQVVTWTTHPHTGKTVKMRIGNLAGVTDATLNPTGYGLYTDNAFLKGSLSAASNQVLINDNGVRIKAYADPAGVLADINAVRFETQAGVAIGGLYSGGSTSGHNIDLVSHAPSAGYALTQVRAVGNTAGSSGAADVFLYAGNDASPTKEAQVRLDVDDTAGLVRLIATDNIRFETATQSFYDALPYLDVGANLGSASKRWSVLYVNQIIAGTISGTSMAGATWQYTGSMVIDANSASDTTVSVVNNHASGAVTFDVAGTITQSGTAVSLSGHTHSTYLLKNGDTITGNISVSGGVTIDGVDISAHAADANAHHNRSHTITSSSDHTVTGAAMDVVGLSATNTLGILTPSSSPGAASALLKSDSSGILTLVQLTASTKVRSPLIDTASGNLSLAPAGGTTAVTGALTVSTTVVATSTVTAASDTDAINTFGRVKLGFAAATDTASFSHFDQHNSTSYALTQNAAGATAVNAANGQTITFSVNNVPLAAVSGGTWTTANWDKSLTFPGNGYAMVWNTSTSRGIGVSGNGILYVSRSAAFDNSAAAFYDLTIDTSGNAVFGYGSVGSSGYASQVSGWQITQAGGADFRYVYTNELHAKSFVADLEMALAGSQIVTKSVAVVAEDFVVPYAGGKQRLVVEDLPSAANMAAFESGDYVRLRTFNRASGSLTIGDVWGTVASYTDGAGVQTWTFTRSGSTTYNTITIRGSATSAASSAATSVAPSKPTGVVSGDALIAVLTHDGAATTVTPPAGWTEVTYQSGSDINLGVYTKTAGGSEGSTYTFTIGASRALAVGIIAFSNCEASFLDDYDIQVNAASTSMTAPSIWASSTAGMLLFLGGVTNNTSSTPPAGMTEQIDAGATGIRVYIATELLAASGLAGTRVATVASSFANIAATMILRPTYSSFTTSTAGSVSPGTIITAKNLALDYGVSGNGYHEINSIDGAYAVNSPYSQVVTWSSHPATGQIVRTRSGNLYGLFGVAGEYGFYAGNGTSTSSNYIRLSSSTSAFVNVPISIYASGTERLRINPTDGFRLMAGTAEQNQINVYDGSAKVYSQYTYFDNGNGWTETVIKTTGRSAPDGSILKLEAELYGAADNAGIWIQPGSINIFGAPLSFSGVSSIGSAWTNLSYASGWGDYGNPFAPGQYKVVGDLVFLRGLVARFSGSSAIIATLPSGVRPAYQCLFSVHTSAGAGNDRVDITTGGAITLVAGGVSYVQLDGLVFSTA